jgi:hypothetical protein
MSMPDPEFIGRARALKSRLDNAAHASEAAMQAIFGPAAADYRRRSRKAGSSLRPETLLEIERDWHKIPTDGGLGVTTKRDRRSLFIEDVRIAPATITNEIWGGPDQRETCLCIVRITLEISPKRVAWRTATIASLGLHGLARRFQRGFDISDQAVLHDLGLLATAARGLIKEAPGSEFTVPTPSGGSWRGSVGPFCNLQKIVAPAANVRTFW